MDYLSVEQMWQACQKRPIAKVAKENGRTARELAWEFRRAGLLGNEPSDPSPEEIARATQSLRSEWDETTERNRWIAARTPDSSFV